jgi:hypothetical protein
VTAAIYMLLRLPWLAPDITTAIVNGRQPQQLSAKMLMRKASRLPADWTEQRTPASARRQDSVDLRRHSAARFQPGTETNPNPEADLKEFGYWLDRARSLTSTTVAPSKNLKNNQVARAKYVGESTRRG